MTVFMYPYLFSFYIFTLESDSPIVCKKIKLSWNAKLLVSKLGNLKAAFVASYIF